MPRDQGVAYAQARTVLQRSAAVLLPPARRTVSEWAAARRMLVNGGGGYSGPWNNAVAPYLTGIMDALGSGRYRRVVVQGPAQAGKTEIGLNWFGATVEDDPAGMIILQPDQGMARTFSTTRLKPMIEAIPELGTRLRGGPSADSVHEKTFRGGMVVSIIWPVGAQLRQRPAARYWADDFDAMPDDIDGEGDPIVLLEGRQTTFEGREVGLVTSSPKKGGKHGVAALRETGSDHRWHWPCPHCGEGFEATSDHLTFDRAGTPDDAAASVTMTCPNNGCVIEARDKRAMMARGAWVAGGQTLVEGRVEGPEPSGSVASFLIDGVIGFATWSSLARAWRAAEIRFDTLQDEQPLRAFHNARLGKNYTSRVAGKAPIRLEDLEARRGAGFVMRRPPAGVTLLVATVDVQADRFEVQVTGFGEGLECWIVDRFSIRQLGDGRTNIDPAGRPEHWHELLGRVFWLTYQREDGATLEILNTGIDTGGIEGATENAYAFWHTARASGVHASRIMLLKGGNRPDAPILARPSWIEHKGGRQKAVPLYVVNVHRLKGILEARLRRAEPGPGYVHLADDFAAEHMAELLAEERDDKGLWQKTGPNETLDLTVYAIAGLQRHAGKRTDMAWLPAQFRARPDTTGEAAPARLPAATRERHSPRADEQPETPAPVSAAPAPVRRRRRGLRGGVKG